MDEIEAFLETLLGNSPTQYKSIAQKAIDIYQGRGELTVKQHAWALRTAKAQRVAVPETFYDLQVFEAKTGRTFQMMLSNRARDFDADLQPFDQS